MERREVGYGTVTVRIIGGQSVKIETTGRHIELEANHMWKKCNYPYYYLSLHMIYFNIKNYTLLKYLFMNFLFYFNTMFLVFIIFSK